MSIEKKYVCTNCNNVSDKQIEKCPSCKEYDTYVELEENTTVPAKNEVFDLSSPTSIPIDLGDYERIELDPSKTSGIEALLSSEEGYIVGRIGNEWLRYNTDAHLLTIAPTGEGKGTGLIIPNLYAHEGSVVVVDIRGETVAKTANFRRLQGHKVIVLDPFNITQKQYGSDSYNPLDRLIQNLDSRSSDDQIQRLVNALMFDPSGRMSNEPIWDNATKNLLSGLIALCIRYWRPYRHNLVEILDVLNYSQPEMERFIVELKGIIDNDPKGKKDRQIKSLYKILTESKSTTKITDNALVQAQTILTWAGNKSFEGIIDHSTFSFDDLQREKMTVYLVVPEEYIDSCAIWVRLMLESAVFSLEDIYSSKGISTSQLPQEDRVLFLLDELPAFGQLDIISSGMATLRGRGVNLWLFIQNLAQLESTYGKEKMRTIIGNAAAIQVFGSTELEELEYFTRLIGEEFFDVQSVGISESETDGTSSSSTVSHTVSNSESFTKTRGTADTYNEATGTTWNKSIGRTKNKSRTYTKNQSTSDGRTSGTSRGSNRGTNRGSNQGRSAGKTYQRNALWSTVKNDNEGSSKGASKGSSEGSNESRSKTRQKGNSEGVTKGSSNTTTTSKGGSHTVTKGHTVNESTAESTQRGETKGTSDTEGTSRSFTSGRNISVKQERMKIETVRTLREKLSGRNQLLQIRGFHPFFVPRMKYYAQYLDTKKFMFPDMAAMSDKDIFDTIASRPELTTPFANHLNTFQPELEIFNSVYNGPQEFNAWLTIQTYQKILDGSLTESINQKIYHVESEIKKQSEAFTETYPAILGFVSMLEKVGFDPFFEKAANYLEICMHNLEVSRAALISLDNDLVDKYKNLPICKINARLPDDEAKWLVKVYAPAAQNFARIMDTQIESLKSKVEKHDKVRVWFLQTFDYIQSKMDDAIFIASERENEWRHQFFLERNGLA